MTYTTEDLERMKISLGITDKDYTERDYAEQKPDSESHIVYVYKYKHKGDQSYQFKAEKDDLSTTPQDSISSLVGSCMSVFDFDVTYMNKLPDKIPTDFAYNLSDIVSLSDHEFELFKDLFEIRVEKFNSQ